MANRLFHYQPFVPEYLESLLSERKIKLSRPDSFNDPWDCRVHYLVPSDEDGRKRYLDWAAIYHRKHFPEVSEAKRARMNYELRKNPEKFAESLAQMDQEMYKQICQQYRVYCLTEKPDCALMWAHYSASHTGICLEFDCEVEPFTAQTGVTKVRYEKLYPAHDLPSVEYDPLIIKSDDWFYEAEWRLIAEEREYARSPHTVKTDHDFYVLPAKILKSIILGSLATQDTRHKVKKLVQRHAPEVIIRTANIALDAYRLDISPSI
jgi:hypothetical protein